MNPSCIVCDVYIFNNPLITSPHVYIIHATLPHGWILELTNMFLLYWYVFIIENSILIQTDTTVFLHTIGWTGNTTRTDSGLYVYWTLLLLLILYGVCFFLWIEMIRRVSPGSNQGEERPLVLVICLGGLYSIIKDHPSLKKEINHIWKGV